MRILLDTNILIDVLQERFPFYLTSQILLDPDQLPTVTRVVAAHSFATVFYLVSKYQTTDTARKAIGFLLENFEVEAVTHDVLKEAAESGVADFEDGIVLVAAARAHCSAIVTRNIKDFTPSALPVYDPESFLALDPT